MAKIGIMGGTFDPIHNGHLLLGEQAYIEYNLKEVWYMPSGNPPHKTDHPVTDMEIRADMVRLALENHQGLVFSDFEIRRSGKTFTAQTLKLLKEQNPDDEYYFIIGADSLFAIENWHLPEEIMKLCVLLVAGRECDDTLSLNEEISSLKEKYQADIRVLHCAEVDISSTELRVLIEQGSSRAWKYIPEKVKDYIIDKRLYRGD